MLDPKVLGSICSKLYSSGMHSLVHLLARLIRIRGRSSDTYNGLGMQYNRSVQISFMKVNDPTLLALRGGGVQLSLKKSVT